MRILLTSKIVISLTTRIIPRFLLNTTIKHKTYQYIIWSGQDKLLKLQKY